MVFDPETDVSSASLIRWFDASDAATLTLTGNLVDQWDDKSSTGDFADSSGTLRPDSGVETQNSLNVISFAGANERLDFNTGITAAWTEGEIFVAARNDDASTGSVVLARDQTYGANYFVLDNPTLGSRLSMNTGSNYVANTDCSTNFEITDVWWDDATNDGEMYINNDNTNSTVVLTTEDWAIGTIGGYTGTTSDMDGVVGEILIYDGQLSSGDRTAVYQYLAEKWLGLSFGGSLLPQMMHQYYGGSG